LFFHLPNQFPENARVDFRDIFGADRITALVPYGINQELSRCPNNRKPQICRSERALR
jgi:hypothetical protein